MSEELFNSASCSGDCTSCGNVFCQSLDHSRPTLPDALDDDTRSKMCFVLNHFPARTKKYIALLPLDENGENEDGEVYLYRYYEET